MIKFSKAHKYGTALVLFASAFIAYHSQFLTDAFAAESEGQLRQMRIDQIESNIASLQREKAREEVERIRAMIQSDIDRLTRKLSCIVDGGARC